MSVTMTPRETGFTVKQGRRTIGFINLWTIRGESAWRFVANREDIARLYPVPSPKFESAESAIAHVREVLE